MKKDAKNPSYKFIQIPKYAFTTDLEQTGEQINDDSGQNIEEKEEEDEDFDFGAALRRAKALAMKAKAAVHKLTA